MWCLRIGWSVRVCHALGMLSPQLCGPAAAEQPCWSAQHTACSAGAWAVPSAGMDPPVVRRSSLSVMSVSVVP